MLCYLCEDSETSAYMKPAASTRNLRTAFSAVGLAIFLDISTILLIYIVLLIFSHFFSVVKDILLNRTQVISLLTSEIYHTKIFLFFSSSFLGEFFWVPIRFERCHFHSGYEPGNMQIPLNFDC